MLPPLTDDLGLDEMSSFTELLDALTTLWVRADKPALRDLEQWALREGKPPLSRTVMSEVRRCQRMPTKEMMLTYVEACGVPADQLEPWQRAWERIAPRDELKTVKAAEATRLARIEQEAKEQAARLVAEARHRGDAIIEDAKRQAEDITGASMHQASVRMAEARTATDHANHRAKAIVETAEAEIGRKLAQAEVQEAQAVRTMHTADQQAQQILADAEQRAQAKADAILQEAREVAGGLLQGAQEAVLDQMVPSRNQDPTSQTPGQTPARTPVAVAAQAEPARPGSDTTTTVPIAVAELLAP